MISQASSEASICFVVPAGEAENTRAALHRAFEVELRHRLIDSIQVKPRVAIVAALVDHFGSGPLDTTMQAHVITTTKR